MGFFSKILGGVVKIARGVLGLPAAAAPVVAAVAPRALAGAARIATGASNIVVIGGKKFIRAASGQFFPIAAGAIAGGIAGTVGSPGEVAAARAGVPFPAPIAMGGALGGGNGQFVRQTIVQTIELATGQVVRSETFPGAPFAMTKDINRIRSLSKKLKRAASKIGGGTRKESKSKQLTDAITDRALQNVIAGGAAGKC